MILIFVQTLVFVNIIHERPQIVAVRHYSLTFIEASSRTCLSSSPITADYCFRCPLVFIARSPILVAFTARKDYSLCEYRSRIVRLGSQPIVPLTRLHRPIVADRSVLVFDFIADSTSPPVCLLPRAARPLPLPPPKGFSLCEYRLSRIVAVRPARSPSPAASSSSPIVVY